ncbi:alpha-mannosidase [Rhizobium sp. RU35A]|uniref:alpha-mannosidase n=1 Tax=Rhizobium sp. RU35A TaxID=1907414 RepID=UPI0009546FF3|nr:glycoside hydrolase family 38 C-terminal domain-containing protein [Rhizobium sp. RU35A]SIQ34524.1 alpha-mannosidase [Rhizobium sp. RU35A]
MKRIRKLDHLLSRLQERIFVPLGVSVDLVYSPAAASERTRMVASDRTGWTPVDRDLVWGEPDGYYWFGGDVTIPVEAKGQRVVVHVDAAFGSVMGRSDPQCLVRVNGAIRQGVDGNHREFLLTDSARPGERFDILIEAGTIEDRRQLGFGCRLMVHDLEVDDLYYDIRVPLDVARLLAADDPRRHFILNHLEAAVDAIDLRPGKDDRFRASMARARAAVQPIYDAQDFEEKPTIVTTGHTHIDVAWLWRVRETRQKMARSMATALSLMQDFPDYRFMYNQCVLLDYLNQDYPELFERIATEVKTGRFEIEGALWLEPDVNIAGGEALVRHILYGVEYHQRTFGVRPRMIWLPDTFGYSASLPQLMEKSGLDSFVTHKLSWNDTNRMPDETMFWQGIDGTKVVAYFLTTQPYDSTSLGTTYCPNLKPTHVMGTWRRHGQQALNKELFLVYGHGDGGGGPTREMLQNIRRMERGIPGCPKVSHETMRPFFERLTGRMRAAPENYPVWVGELYAEFHRGTLTSVAKNKRNNRLAEIALREIEMLAVLAERRGLADYPAAELRRLWDIVMLNQFHDILPGSSIGYVYEDSDRDYADFFASARQLTERLTMLLAPADQPAIFNATGRSRDGLAMSEASVVPGREQVVVRADGSTAHAVSVSGLAPLAFSPLEDVLQAPAGESALSVSTTHLENDRLSVRFDAHGRITSLFDKLRQRQILPEGTLANRLTAFRDMPAQYDAWDIDADFEDQSFEIDDLVSAEVVETGPLRAAIRFEWRYENSSIVQIVSLAAGAGQVEVDCLIDWNEHNTLVKAGFPVAVNAAAVDAEIQFGHVRRASHRNTSWDRARFECSMQRWVDVSEPAFGVALLNDCKYGYDVKGTEVRLTLLRSPTYPWPEADQGEHRLRYAVLPHDGDKRQVHEAAEHFNLPLAIVRGGSKASQMPAPLLTIESEGVALESVKRAESGDGIIVRLWETTGTRRNATLRLDPGLASATQVDLLEEGGEAVAIEDGRVTLAFRPFDIITLKLAD